MSEPVPPTLAAMLLAMLVTGRPMEWSEVVASTGRPHCNTFRHLRRRGWVQHPPSHRPYLPGEPWTGPRVLRYELTKEGLRIARSLRP